MVKIFKLSLIFISITFLSGCPVAILDVRPRGDDIVYDSYTEAYDEAYEECTNNPRFATKTLAECLKIMDFQENVNYRSLDDYNDDGDN